MEAIRANSNASTTAPQKIRAKAPYSFEQFWHANTIVSHHTIGQPVKSLSLSGETTQKVDDINSPRSSLGSTSEKSSVTGCEMTAPQSPSASCLSTSQILMQMSVLCTQGLEQSRELEKREQENLEQITSLKTDVAVAQNHIARQQQTIEELNQQISKMGDHIGSMEAANDNIELVNAVENLVETLTNALATFNAVKAQPAAK